MCISEGVSWTTLAIGSVLNILILIYLSQIPDPKVIIPIILILGWQYALLMQIPDALAWRHPTAQYPGKLAFILNVTQPLVLFILVVIGLTKLGISLVRLIPAIVALTVYSILTIKDTVNRTDYNIQPPQHCKHLALQCLQCSHHLTPKNPQYLGPGFRRHQQHRLQVLFATRSDVKAIQELI